VIFFAFLALGIGLILAGLGLNRIRRRRTGKIRIVLACCILPVCLLAALSFASAGYAYWYTHRSQPAPERRTLFRGIEYVRDVRQKPRLMVIHVVTVDLNAPGLRFLVTPPQPTAGRDLAARKTSAFLDEFHLQLAINANYFYPFRSESPFDYFPHAGDGVDLCGFAASEGRVYSNKAWRPGTLYLSKDNRASFETPIGPVYNAISRGGFILRDGVVQPPPLISDEKDIAYPRTALGLSEDGRTLILMVIDGKQPGYSKGATLTELGEIIREHGAFNAIRLDEGGSSALAFESEAGHSGLLNIPINNRIPYRERVVANHLGIFARRND
jgi:hypothetical protein